MVFVDEGVAAAWPRLCAQITQYVEHLGDAAVLARTPVIIGGGEDAKNEKTLALVLAELATARLCRQSFVIAVGGGAVLDSVGFAAAIVHRGLRLIRVPTTTLAQGDSAVGVKNGINAFGRKNFIGCFSVPWAVINDGKFLASLSDRDWRSGLAEALKVALLKDIPFFEQLHASALQLMHRDHKLMNTVLRRSAELHLEHIIRSGDPFERSNARPLDLGHWSAHKLESLSRFQLRHGEAVAIGLALDAVLSQLLCGFPEREVLRIISSLIHMSLPVYDTLLEDSKAVIEGLEEFREHLGGQLSITLLKDIAKPVQVSGLRGEVIIHAVRILSEIWLGMSNLSDARPAQALG
jgi:3-dehydroquinate synthase